MIGISTPTYDAEGSILLKDIEDGNDIMTRSRRLTRTATIDGGSEIEDMGMSHSDRTFVIRTRGLSKTKFDKLALLVEQYPLLIITTEDGAYKGAPDRINIYNDITILRILIKEKIS